MKSSKYQELARTTALYPGVGELKEGNILPLCYLIMGLTGEAGEVAEKTKKMLRDKNGVIDEEFIAGVRAELGDVMWYLSNICSELDISLGKVMKGNIRKLLARRERNTLHGEGDVR